MRHVEGSAPPLTLGQRIQIGIGRLAARSDVLVTRFVSLGRQPAGALAKELPADLLALYEDIGPCSLHWTFVDPARGYGHFSLRAPGGVGWIGLEGARPEALPRPDGYVPFRTLGSGDPITLTDPTGQEPWPAGTRFAIVEGAEEGGLLLRMGPRPSYAAFDSDGVTRELGDDLASIVDDLVCDGFSGYRTSYGKTLREQLGTPAALRPTAKIEVLDARHAPWAEVRGRALAALAPFERKKVGEALGLRNVGSAPALEAGARIAEATRDAGSIDAKVLKAFSGVKKTKTALAQKFFVKEPEPYVVLRLAVTAQKSPYPALDYEALKYPPTDADGEFLRKQSFLPNALTALRVLADVEGVDLSASGSHPDVLRYCAWVPRVTTGWAHELVEGSDGPTTHTTLAVPAAVAGNVRTGTVSLSGARVLYGGPAFAVE